MLQKLRQRHSKLCNVHLWEDHLKSLNLLFVWLFDYDWLCIIYSIIYVTCIVYIKYIIDMVLHDIKHRHQSVSIIVFQLHWVIQFGSRFAWNSSCFISYGSEARSSCHVEVMEVMGWSPKCCCLRRAYPLELVLDSTAWISWDLPRLGEPNLWAKNGLWGTGTASYRASK